MHKLPKWYIEAAKQTGLSDDAIADIALGVAKDAALQVAIGIVTGGVIGGAARVAAPLAKRISAAKKVKGLTDHGGERFFERGIKKRDITDAIRTARETGNVGTKFGKYNTPQIEYRGTNGITVYIETKGRNAGKIITIIRQKN